MLRRQFDLSHLICVAKHSPSVTPFVSRASTRAKFSALYPKPLSAFDRLSSHVPTISCIVCWINSLNESSCCRTKPFSSKKELMTTHASSYVCTKTRHFSLVSLSIRARASERRLQPIPSPPRSASRASSPHDHHLAFHSLRSTITHPHARTQDTTNANENKMKRSHPRVVVGCVDLHLHPAPFPWSNDETASSSSSHRTYLTNLFLLFLHVDIGADRVFVVVHAHRRRVTEPTTTKCVGGRDVEPSRGRERTD